MTESPFSHPRLEPLLLRRQLSPLNFTDPSGYCFMGCFWQSAFRAIGNFFRQNWGSIFQITVTATCAMLTACAPFLPIVAGLAAGFVTGVTSGNLGLAIRSGIIASATALAFQGVGELTSGLAAVDPTGGAAAPMTSGSPLHLLKVAGHAAVGCLSAVASGGGCGPGAMAAGASAAATPFILDAFPDPKGNAAHLFGGTAASAVLGGLGSVAGGDKFGNGAVTAAFGYLFNAMNHRMVRGYARPDLRDWEHMEEVGAGESATIKTGDRILIAASSSAFPPTNQFWYSVEAVPLRANGTPETSIATPDWSRAGQYSSGLTGTGYSNYFEFEATSTSAANSWRWTVAIPPQQAAHDNTMHNRLQVYVPRR